jgi:rare lipoprotein A
MQTCTGKTMKPFWTGVAVILKQGLLVAACMQLLAGCAAKKPDAARPPDGRRVKASQRPYTVLGQRYEPLASHEGFSQTGIASWYGPDFHGKATSNGERYDMHAMTAAHKTLPLGVYVKVQNRENGRETVVRVNDRGPFVKGRIIDLSYAAARKLGVDIRGTAPVRVEALGYQADGRSGYQKPENYDAGTYTVQVGAFKQIANAQRLTGHMKKLHGFSEMHRSKVNTDLFYRVYAGKFRSLSEAESAERDFSQQGYPGSFVVSLD